MATKEEETKNIFQRTADGIQRYFKETIGELRKVTWPTRKEATNLTVVVLVVTVFMSVVLGGLDALFTRIMALIFAT